MCVSRTPDKAAAAAEMQRVSQKGGAAHGPVKWRVRVHLYATSAVFLCRRRGATRRARRRRSGAGGGDNHSPSPADRCKCLLIRGHNFVGFPVQSNTYARGRTGKRSQLGTPGWVRAPPNSAERAASSSTSATRHILAFESLLKASHSPLCKPSALLRFSFAAPPRPLHFHSRTHPRAGCVRGRRGRGAVCIDFTCLSLSSIARAKP